MLGCFSSLQNTFPSNGFIFQALPPQLAPISYVQHSHHQYPYLLKHGHRPNVTFLSIATHLVLVQLNPFSFIVIHYCHLGHLSHGHHRWPSLSSGHQANFLQMIRTPWIPRIQTSPMAHTLWVKQFSLLKSPNTSLVNIDCLN